MTWPEPWSDTPAYWMWADLAGATIKHHLRHVLWLQARPWTPEEMQSARIHVRREQEHHTQWMAHYGAPNSHGWPCSSAY